MVVQLAPELLGDQSVRASAPNMRMQETSGFLPKNSSHGVLSLPDAGDRFLMYPAVQAASAQYSLGMPESSRWQGDPVAIVGALGTPRSAPQLQL